MERLISFQNQGQNLYGMLHLPDGPDPHPAAILLHGFTGHRSESHFIFTKQARHLAGHGVAALRFDFRGSGESEGDFSEMTVQGEISDAAAALDFLSAQPEIDAARLGVLGLSLGGCVAACLAGRDPRVKALALWSAPAQLRKLLEKGAAEAGQPAASLAGGYDVGGLLIGPGLIQDLLTLQPLEEVAAFSGPTLVVQGTHDESVALENAHAYTQALSGEKRLVVVEGADHTFSSIPWEQEVIAASTNWFVRHL